MQDSLPAMVERCARVLDAAYMAQRLIRIDRNLKGWRGCPVALYAYETGYDSTARGPKLGKVYLYNPSPERLARWIMNACWKVKGSLDYRYTERMRRQVLYQSGGQFPVSGVVYEAMYRAGDYYPYLFKDGGDGLVGRHYLFCGRQTSDRDSVGFLPQNDEKMI